MYSGISENTISAHVSFTAVGAKLDTHGRNPLLSRAFSIGTWQAIMPISIVSRTMQQDFDGILMPALLKGVCCMS
jgi:hypothetical protein